MRVLITGVAGSLGSNIAGHLLARGDEVLGIDNFKTGSTGAIVGLDQIRFVEGTIADRDFVQDQMSAFRPDLVVHSAASYKDPDNWLEDISTNVTGTANLVQGSIAVGAKRFVNFQTALCYGKPRETPVTLSHPLAPFTSYGISKTAGELYLMASGLPYVSLRMASVYGPHHYVGPIPTFYRRLKAGQKCFVTDTRRDYVAMADFLDLFDRIAAKSAPTGVFHHSTGADISIKEIFDAVAAEIGIKLDTPVEVRPADPDDVASILLDPSKTEKAFGWKPNTPFRKGLHDLIAWYDEHGVEQTFSHLRGQR
ncbi:MAG: NAD-dependent epimerase/dehydratase family protein [Rhizomicrobium sp.]